MLADVEHLGEADQPRPDHTQRRVATSSANRTPASVSWNWTVVDDSQPAATARLRPRPRDRERVDAMAGAMRGAIDAGAVRSPSQTASFSRSAAVRRSTWRAAGAPSGPAGQVDVGRARVREPPGACRRRAAGTTPPTRRRPDRAPATSRGGCGATAARAARSWRPRRAAGRRRANAARACWNIAATASSSGRASRPARAQRSERRPALDGQRVRRDVIGRERDRARRPRAASRRATGRGRRTSDRSTRCRTPPRAPRARTAGPAAASWLRPSAASSRSSNACTPIDSRLTPAPRSAGRCASSTSPGLASTVISSAYAARAAERRARRLDHARRARPRRHSPASRRRSRSTPAARPRRTTRARAWISATTASAYASCGTRRACRRRSRSTGSERCRTGSGRRRPAARPGASAPEKKSRRRGASVWRRESDAQALSTPPPARAAGARCEVKPFSTGGGLPSSSGWIFASSSSPRNRSAFRPITSVTSSGVSTSANVNRKRLTASVASEWRRLSHQSLPYMSRRLTFGCRATMSRRAAAVFAA